VTPAFSATSGAASRKEQSMAGRLDGQVAVITGSGRGIGRASAELFAREGASVVVSDIDAESARQTAQAISEAGGRAVGHPADVTDSAAVDRLVERAVAEFGRLDVMFNNAGGALPEVTHEVSDEQYRSVMELNADGVFFGTRAALRVMVPQKSGCILITASGAGLGSVEGLAVYGMAKASVISLARSVAEEYGPLGIRANVVSPGPIASESFVEFLDSVEGLRTKMEKGVPARRLGRPEDIARTALFLASNEASYVSGIVVPVDGGISSSYPSPSPTPNVEPR